MKIRTCPHCQYQYSLKDYFFKLGFKSLGEKWHCLNCGQPITFSGKRRVGLVAVFGVLLLGLLYFKNTFSEGIGMLLFLFLSMLIIGGLFIFTFDTFKKA